MCVAVPQADFARSTETSRCRWSMRTNLAMISTPSSNASMVSSSLLGGWGHRRSYSKGGGGGGEEGLGDGADRKRQIDR